VRIGFVSLSMPETTVFPGTHRWSKDLVMDNYQDDCMTRLGLWSCSNATVSAESFQELLFEFRTGYLSDSIKETAPNLIFRGDMNNA
jgi:hypothetical protein